MLFKSGAIVRVCDELGMKRAKYNSSQYCCPLCGDTKYKLNVDANKNVWRCAKCGMGSGLIGLITHVRDCTNEEAKEFLQKLDITTTDRSEAVGEYRKPVNGKVEYTYSVDYADLIYRKILSRLTLTDEHKAALIKRGLTEEEIEKSLYRSFPVDKDTQKWLSWMFCTGHYTLDGVPGFYEAGDGWNMVNYGSGFFVPFIDENGKIASMQIRLDNPQHSRYVAFSSKKYPGGTGAQLSFHMIGNPESNNIYITEGALKADVAASLYKQLGGNLDDMCIIAIAGVNNTKALYYYLYHHPNRNKLCVYDWFDMDKLGNKNSELNENVQKAVATIQEKIEQMGILYQTCTWPREKGIDDYLLWVRDRSRKKVAFEK